MNDVKKVSEKVLAQAIQAYVLDFGETQAQAGFILQQIDGPWADKKDYILECMTNAFNDDDYKSIEYTPEIVYSDLVEDAFGWNGDSDGTAMIQV